MKKLTGLAFVLMAAGASPAMALDVTGTWQLDAQFGTSWFSHPVCIFQQATFKTGGQRFAGSCAGPSYLGTVAGGVNGSAVQFEWDADAIAPGPGTVVHSRAMFSGVQSPDGVIRGTAKDSSNVVGSFTLTKK